MNSLRDRQPKEKLRKYAKCNIWRLEKITLWTDVALNKLSKLEGLCLGEPKVTEVKYKIKPKTASLCLATRINDLQSHDSKENNTKRIQSKRCHLLTKMTQESH